MSLWNRRDIQQAFGKMRLFRHQSVEEHEHSNRFVRILESDSVSLYRLDNFLYGIILTHDCTL